VPGEAFCDYCGSPLEAPVPSAEAAPELEPVSTEAELEAAAEPAAPEAEEAPVEPDVEAEPTCPACGAKVQPDEAFCADCGAALAEAPIPPEPVVEEAPPAPVVEVEPEPVAEEAPPEPVVEVEPEPVVEEAPPTPEPAAAFTCPACGAEAEAGDTFCSSCGAALGAPPVPSPAPVAETPAPSAEAPAPAVGPRLVVSASGAEIPLPAADEVLIGREDPVSGIYPEVDLTPHGGEDGGVSRRHARLIFESGSYFIEDLDSTNFTFVNRQKLAPKTRHPLNDGDEIRCGRVALVLKTG
jgi:hypothetical protein